MRIFTKRALAEVAGTCCMVFIGCGAIMFNERTGALGNLGISLAFGLVVSAMILLFARTSGAHINPAVSIGLWITGKLGHIHLLEYIIAQMIGAMIAMGILHLVYPNATSFGETLPHAGTTMSLWVEFLLTAFLMAVILYCVECKHSVKLVAVLVGGAVALDAFLGGPLTGASMNPARSIAPALASGRLSELWIYIVAPIAGAVFVSFLWIKLKMKERINHRIS